MHKTEYIDYLQSDDWKIRRKELMDLANWICSNCGEKAILLHHLNYNNLGNEELDIDVITLCTDCHNEIHEKGDYGYDEYKGY